MKRLLTIWLVLFSAVPLSWSYQMFQERIPNGNNVPHPCKANYQWPGVGHENPYGGGKRNPFGLDFAAADFAWTRDLCMKDSDGDGKANGQELGDPNCTWMTGTIPSQTTGISHPGVCDPYNSPQCAGKNPFLTCTIDGFQACQAIINNTNVSTIDLTFPPTRVPTSETNYFCMTFDLPSDQDYHIVADQPLVDNINVVHHMLLFGCKNPEEANDPVPVSCGMNADGNCASIIGGWTVGATGSCYNEKVGFRIGKTAFKRVRLEIHYNNPMLIQNYVDSSGLRLYYQPARDDYQDLVTFTTGQLLLTIPPGQRRVEITGTCPGDCTRRQLSKPVNVTNVFNHMHYLGISMSVVVYRDGMPLKNLSYDELYSYDSPVDHIQNPPFTILPGDEIKTTCVYNTLSTYRYTFYGESTSDEMCFGFITMYPSQNVVDDSCVSIGTSSICDIKDGKPIDQCDWGKFYNFSDPDTAQIVKDVTRNCNLDGFCRPECRSVLNGLKHHPCLQGQANLWVTRLFTSSTDRLEFLGRLHSCPMDDDCSGQCPDCYSTGQNGAHKIIVPSVILVLTLTFAFFV